MAKRNLSYYGYAHTLKKNDKRQKIFKEQRKKFGFDDTETWSLYQTITEFTLPRLKRYREINGTRKENKKEKPVSVILEDDIAEKIDKIIIAFEIIIENGFPMKTNKDYEICQQALVDFAEIFPSLWW